MSNNIFYYDSARDGALYSSPSTTNTYGPEFVVDRNLYFDTASAPPGTFANPTPFPGALSWRQWRTQAGHDSNSKIADPIFANPKLDDFSFSAGAGSAAGSLGIVPLAVDDAGPDW